MLIATQHFIDTNEAEFEVYETGKTFSLMIKHDDMHALHIVLSRQSLEKLSNYINHALLYVEQAEHDNKDEQL